MKTGPFRGRVLESLLIVVSVAVAVGAVTVVTNLMALTRRAEGLYSESLYARQLAVKPKAEDYEAFYQGAVAADVREVGPKGSVAPRGKRKEKRGKRNPLPDTNG